jgi:hypothetical protein
MRITRRRRVDKARVQRALVIRDERVKGGQNEGENYWITKQPPIQHRNKASRWAG